MKTFEQYLTEAVKGNSVCIMFKHDDPEITYIILGGTSQNMRKYFGWETQGTFIKNPKNIIYVKHDNENCYADSVASSVAEMEAKAQDQIKKEIAWVKAQDDIDDESKEQGWCWKNECLETCDGACFNIPFSENVKKIRKEIINSIKGSSIDGDSSMGHAVIDLASKKVVYNGGLDIHIMSFEEFKMNYEEDEE